LLEPELLTTDLKPSISAHQLMLVLSGTSTYITLLPQFVLIQGLLSYHALSAPTALSTKYSIAQCCYLASILM
jgi:hypothetical protein